MGGNLSVAKNVSRQSIVAQVDILNASAARCTSNISQTENFTCAGGSDCTNNGTINYSETGTLDATCMATAVNDSSVTSQISEAASQAAKAISQNFSPFTLAVSSASNINTQLIKSGITVTNTDYAKCVTNAFQAEQINITGGSTFVNNGTINFSETMSSVMECTVNANNVNTVQQNLGEEVTQVATAIEQNALAVIALVALLIVFIFFFFDFGVVNSLLNWKTLAVIGIFIVIYILLAFHFGFWPFHNSNSNDASSKSS